MSWLVFPKRKKYLGAMACFCFVGAGLLAYAAMDAFLDCVAVLKYTIPAQEKGTQLILQEYIQNTGLINHFLQMPSSAQRAFLFSGFSCFNFFVLSVVAFVFIIALMKRIRQPKMVRASKAN